MNNFKKIFKRINERKVEKEKNAKINEKKKEDESKTQVVQVILMIHKKYINKLLISIYKTTNIFFFNIFFKAFYIIGNKNEKVSFIFSFLLMII